MNEKGKKGKRRKMKIQTKNLVNICVLIASFSIMMIMFNENISAQSTNGCTDQTPNSTIHQRVGGTYNATSNLINAVSFTAICNPDLTQPLLVGMTFDGVKLPEGTTPFIAPVGLSQCQSLDAEKVSVECRFDIRTAYYDEETRAYYFILFVQFPAGETNMSDTMVQSSVESGTACISNIAMLQVISDQKL